MAEIAQTEVPLLRRMANMVVLWCEAVDVEHDPVRGQTEVPLLKNIAANLDRLETHYAP